MSNFSLFTTNLSQMSIKCEKNNVCSIVQERLSGLRFRDATEKKTLQKKN